MSGFFYCFKLYSTIAGEKVIYRSFKTGHFTKRYKVEHWSVLNEGKKSTGRPLRNSERVLIHKHLEIWGRLIDL